jgi:acyl-[acyl-carrier-protein]-phospholipid O-acyltransferase/long-chain-fatty-acid--[acyl-carrier-protein] ligase
MKIIVKFLLRLLYGFRAYNPASLKTPGPVLLLSNHVSWWDWLLLGACLEDDWRFVTSSTTAELSWVHRRLMINRRTFPVDMNSPYAVKHIAEYLQRGGRLVMFPEGRLSMTGSLMKLFDGTAFLVHKTHAKVVTAHIRGAERLPFSPNPDRKRWFPRLSVHFSDVLVPPVIEGIGASGARARLMDWIGDRMALQRFETEMAFGPATLPAAILAAARQEPAKVILQDVSMQPLTYRRLVIGADLLAARWRELLGPEEARVGVLLPNVNAMPAVLLSLWAADKIPAVLNYTTGPAILLSCARLAGLKHVITSEAFITRSKLDVAPLRAAGIQLIFLEEVRAGISRPRKFAAALKQLPGLHLSGFDSQPDRAAAILFTSGSEGDPKGVELTHRNLLANIRQMLAVVDLMDTDRFFIALPLFHSFGLTIGLLLPLVRRVFVFLYLSPLHYRIVPSAFYNLDCTVFFGTNTFLGGYGRRAHPYDFRTARYLFAGAEKLHDSTAALWMRKFGVRVLEGYGVTECSPCLSANLPMHPRQGSAGRFLPAIEYRIDPVEGITPRQTIEDHASSEPDPDHAGPSSHPAAHGTQASPTPCRLAGRLLVRGPNVMRGYLNPEANGRFQALGGWYDTGDIAEVDADGYLHILGRLKRFAKISGEMVSLTAVEDALAGAFPQHGLKFAVAVITKPDELKGERLIAVTNEPKLTLEQVRQAIKARGLTNLAVPRELKYIHELPHLGTGKVNHRELARMV